MNLGRQESLREGPCTKGHAWTPVAPAPGRPGFNQFHCRICGEWATMSATGEPDPRDTHEARILQLEHVVAELHRIVMHGTILLPPPKES